MSKEKKEKNFKKILSLKRYYRINTVSNLEKARDPWERWASKSQLFRYKALKESEESMQNALEEHGITEYHSRFFFESESEREQLTRELLVDLRFKVLFYLHILIEEGDREAILFTLKELLQKGFVSNELEKLDSKTLENLEVFLKSK